jgi:hypothetical protein
VAVSDGGRSEELNITTGQEETPALKYFLHFAISCLANFMFLC